MELSNNQRCIRISKQKSDKDNPYSIFNYDALQGALKNLKPNSFKLWAYLNANANNYVFAFSSAAFRGVTGMAANTYRGAWQDLVDKGYLVFVDDLGNGLSGFIFLEKGMAAQQTPD